MTQSPFQSPADSGEPRSQRLARNQFGFRALRVFAGIFIPIPLLVVASFIITDIFYFNRGPDYLRLSENYAAHIFIDLFLQGVLTGLFVGLPLVIYSLLLEYICNSTIARCLLGLGFGALIAALQFYYFGNSFSLASRWETVEAFVDFLGPIVILLGVSLLIGQFSDDGGRVKIDRLQSNS